MIFLQNFEKSNQNTYFLQRPITYTSQWIQKGDLLSDCSASSKGELALGKNLFVGYMSWEGLNFEDAVLINRQIVSKYLSLHIEKYEIELGETPYGPEKIIRSFDSKKFDKNGIPKIGSWIKEGEILIGKTIPTVPSILLTHEKLLSDVVGGSPLPPHPTSPPPPPPFLSSGGGGGGGEDKSEVQKKYLTVPSSGRIIRICYTHSKQYTPTNWSGRLTAAEGERSSSVPALQKRFGKEHKFKAAVWGQYQMMKRFNILPIQILLRRIGRSLHGRVLSCRQIPPPFSAVYRTSLQHQWLPLGHGAQVARQDRKCLAPLRASSPRSLARHMEPLGARRGGPRALLSAEGLRSRRAPKGGRGACGAGEASRALHPSATRRAEPCSPPGCSAEPFGGAARQLRGVKKRLQYILLKNVYLK